MTEDTTPRYSEQALEAAQGAGERWFKAHPDGAWHHDEWRDYHAASLDAAHDPQLGPNRSVNAQAHRAEVIAELLSDGMCDAILDELVVIAGGNRGYTDERVPFARWDMKHALREALKRVGCKP